MPDIAKENAREKIAGLVERFRQNIDAYKAGSYNETQVRREFIDPFFEALGWDVANRAGYAEQYKDVVHEDSIKVGVSLKAPDYSFRVGGQRKFFLEAKKPSISIKDDISPAYQLRRYAWSAKLSLSILTDFEELAVYDCRVKPSEKDKVTTGRVAYYSYSDYVEKFDEIYGAFSKEEVYKGSFDRYAESSKVKKGTAEVDGAFLKEIESWRDLLARNLALRNQSLTVDELNFAVQNTVDRVIFLRICEDRGIENYGRLQAFLNGTNVYERLFELFHEADDKYNSGLFDFKADRLSRGLSIDDKVLKEIIENLYPPKSPYEFSVIGADILGNVYEQFLGKVIRLTGGHQAKVEEKPEVKKAGGVYYTPRYIVDYIVKNTVGRLLGDNPPTPPLVKGEGSSSPSPLAGEGRGEGGKRGKSGLTPNETSKLRILDPACGSGSFLIGAYQYLLDWHLKWYMENGPEKYARGKAPAVYHGKSGWRLTTVEKKRILLNNIYGVDIDRQAVEVTKLSLLLKVLEDENAETIGKNLALFRERVLPNLDENIRCGNSLIGPDFYLQQELELDDAASSRINVFDWNDDKKGFGKIMKEGGFDAVIGNPPYVRQEMLGDFKPYFSTHYRVYHGVADLYVYFIEKAHHLLDQRGLFGFICSNKFMRANYGKPLRDFLSQQTKIRQIIDFGELPVFRNAATFPAVILTEREAVKKQSFVYAPIKRLSFKSLEEEIGNIGESLDGRSLASENWTLAGAAEMDVIEKMRKAGTPLGEYVGGKIYRGVLTGLNEAFVVDADTKNRLIAEDPKNGELIKPFVVGDDIRKYRIGSKGRFLIFARRNVDIKQYPAVEKHLAQFKTRLIPKPKGWKGKEWTGRKPGDYMWYEIQDTVDYYKEFEGPKIIYPDIAKESRFAFSDSALYFSNTAYFIPTQDLYLLALLNSRLIFSYFKRNAAILGDADKGGRLRWFRQDVAKLPIRAIDFSNKAEKALHDKMVSLVDRMLELNKRLRDAKTPHDRDLLERRIKATDDQIDALVYELYGLTEDEIRIVEGNNT